MADNKNIIDEARDAKDSNEPEIKYQDEAPVFTERKRWLFFGLPWTFTQYLLKDEILTTNKGFLKPSSMIAICTKLWMCSLKNRCARRCLVWERLCAIHRIPRIRC